MGIWRRGKWGEERKELGWRGGAREGDKIGWLMFYDTWFQLIYTVQCIIGGRGGVGGREVKMGRQGVGRVKQGGGKGWLVHAV